MTPTPSPPPGVQAAIDALRAHGERMTAGRRAILQVMATADRAREHLTSEEIFHRATDLAGGLHRASVYRSLATWDDLGVVDHTHIGGSAAVYHLTARTPPCTPLPTHGHLQCTTCRRITDVPADLLAPLQRSLRHQLGFHLDLSHAALLGTCADCAPTPSANPPSRRTRTRPR